MQDISQLSWGQALGFCRLFLWLSMSIWCLPHAHSASGRTELLAWRGKAQGVPCTSWGDLEEHESTALIFPLQHQELPSRAQRFWGAVFMLSVCGWLLSPGHCAGEFALLLAESWVYLIFNLVSSKIGWGISVCPVWCLNIRMWRGCIYLHGWTEVGSQKKENMYFSRNM